MRYEVICHCCKQPISVTFEDFGKAVLCPATRELVPVTRESMTAIPESLPSRNRQLIALAAFVLLALGITAVILWPKGESPQTFSGPVEEYAQKSSPNVLGSPNNVSNKKSPTTNPLSGTSNLTAQEIESKSTSGLISSRSSDPSNVLKSGPRLVPAESERGKENSGKSPSNNDSQLTEVGKDSRFASFRLDKRIDLRSSDELRKELLRVREIRLDTVKAPDTSAKLIAYAHDRASARLTYPGPLVAAIGRPDLASLPFLSGPDAMLSRDRARNMAALSIQLREVLQKCIPSGGTDPRPNPDTLYAKLVAEGSDFQSPRWATEEAVPCILQMLQPEEAPVRRMSLELLRRIDSVAATSAIVSWAVFDLDASCRAAAVDALRSRDQTAIINQLMTLIRYPWPRAAEHAAEALVALKCDPAIPKLAAILALASPDAPITFPADKSREVKYQRELVRTNHARNCVLCHAPSVTESDLVRGAIPDPNLPLASPLTPNYYAKGQAFVAAEQTYLRQDFSTFQPVANPGIWPLHQRYDFLISFRQAGGDAEQETDPAYRAAVLFALRELSGKNLGNDLSAWMTLRGNQEDASDNAQAAIALAILSEKDSSPFLMLKFAEFGSPFLGMTESERFVVSARLRKTFGWSLFRLAMIAYLEPLTHTGDEQERTLASRLLAQFLAETSRSGDLTQEELKGSVDALKHKNAKLRVAAIGNLHSAADAVKYWEQLVRVLQNDPDASVRREAALSLASLKNVPLKGISALAACCESEQNAEVRVAIAGALRDQQTLDGSFGKRLVDLLLAQWKWDSPEQHRKYLDALADALVRLGKNAEGATSSLARAAARPKSIPSGILSRVLLAAGPPSDEDLPHLVAGLKNKDLQPALETLLLVERDRAVGHLIEGMKSNDANMRAASAEILGPAAALQPDSRNRVLWRKAIDALATAKLDSSPEVRAAARTSLEKLTPPQ